MDPDSFTGKILVSVIDKLFIGLAASGLVLYFQYAQGQADLVNQQRIAVGRVWTDELAAERAKLRASTSGFLELVDGLTATGMAREATAARLDQLGQDIHGTVLMLQAVHLVVSSGEESVCHPRDDAVLEEFTRVTNELTLALLSERMPPPTVQEKRNELLHAYVGVLDFVGCLALDTVHHEVERMPSS